MDINILAGLMKRVYPDFNLESFDYRLELQKVVFLLRGYGLDLGYTFNLYLRGPYSPDLARDAFLVEDWTKIPLVKWESPDQEEKFLRFLKFIEPFKNKPHWLEGASTIRLLRDIRPDLDKSQLLNLFLHIKKTFKMEDVTDIYSILEKEGFFNDYN